jgi:hypothetical protein
VRKSAAALLLASRVGQRFDAIVTGASPKGTWVRILHPPVEARVVRGYIDFVAGGVGSGTPHDSGRRS